MGNYRAFAIPFISNNAALTSSPEEQANTLAEKLEQISSSLHHSGTFTRKKRRSETGAIGMSGGVKKTKCSFFYDRVSGGT